MADGGTRNSGAHPRKAAATRDFQQWLDTLDPERKAKVAAAVARVVAVGPTLGRPRVDVVHGSALRKLKEARVDRGIRLLFAFDSNQNAIMLVGGDKTGKWNRWYRPHIERAERLYVEHERNNGKETRWLNVRGTGRTSLPRSL